MIVKGGGKTESDVQYSAKDVSDHIINYCSSVGRPITNLELQKILYFVAGEFFRISGRDIIAEDFESWQIGPVIPGVYDTFSIYGGDPLKPVSTKARSHRKIRRSSTVLSTDASVCLPGNLSGKRMKRIRGKGLIPCSADGPEFQNTR